MHLPPARDGRNQHYFIPILKRILLRAQKANILVVHIHVDEPAQLAVFNRELGARLASLGGLLCRRRWSLLEQPAETVLVQNRHAQFNRFVVFGAR